MNREPRIELIGDSTLVVAIDQRDDTNVEVNCRVIALARAIEAARLDGVLDVVPTFQTVGVYFDPLKTAVDDLTSRLRTVTASSTTPRVVTGVLHRIPVCYGGAFGPDLAEVAAQVDLSEEAVASLHARPTYRVFMLGFTPGFAYLGPVDPAIARPRRAVPRVTVPAGSVAIAGRQTGIYPSASPGGWNVIGRTPIRLFDIESSRPFLFAPGDSVQFFPIDPVALLP